MLITSKDNRAIKLWKQLSSDGRARRKNRLFAAEGARLCADAATSGIVVREVLYTARAAELYAEYLQTILAVAHNDFEITTSIAQYMADTTSPQGIFCICELPQNQMTLAPTGRYLGLEDVQDPANMGAVIRTAEALGIDGLLLSDGCCDVYGPKVLRSSMGGVFRLPLLQVGNMTDMATRLREQGFVVYACVPSADALCIDQVELRDGCIPLIGNEGNGLKPQTIAASDAQITIPMDGRAESLNAAMAAGIVMWELKRR